MPNSSNFAFNSVATFILFLFSLLTTKSIFIVFVIPSIYSTPIVSGNYTICSVGNQFTKGLKIDTVVPQVGTKLYLTDGVTPAIIGNLSSFDIDGVVDFNSVGIAWVRFVYSAGGSDLYTKIMCF